MSIFGVLFCIILPLAGILIGWACLAASARADEQSAQMWQALQAAKAGENKK
jgi:hypothetical protein